MQSTEKSESNAKKIQKNTNKLSNSIKKLPANDVESLDHDLFFDRLLEKIEVIEEISFLIFPKLKAIKTEYNNLCKNLESLNQKELARYELLRLEIKECKILERDIIVKSIDHFLEIAEKNKMYLCKKYGNIYSYNGKFWKIVEEEKLKDFLTSGLLKIGVNYSQSKYYKFVTDCFLQIYRSCIEAKINLDATLINLNNGTLEIDAKQNKIQKRKHSHLDFLTYCLNFDYNPESKAPIFTKYLNEVQPDITVQKVLSEYVGSIFIPNEVAKIEKILLIHGSGGNGKSVFSDVITALFGIENITNYSLEVLTNPDSFSRHKINNKLLNYSSDASPKLNPAELKILASGEPIEAKVKYKDDIKMVQYAKIIVNMNQLPITNDYSDGFFRRFLIVEFNAFHSNNGIEQNTSLHNEIINSELSGVLNFVLDGLKRFLDQKKFTESEAIKQNLEQFIVESDPVRQFLEQKRYISSITKTKVFADIFNEFCIFCSENNFHKLTSKSFSNRLKNLRIASQKTRNGMILHLETSESQQDN